MFHEIEIQEIMLKVILTGKSAEIRVFTQQQQNNIVRNTRNYVILKGLCFYAFYLADYMSKHDSKIKRFIKVLPGMLAAC